MGVGGAAAVDPVKNTASLIKMPIFEDENKGIAHYIWVTDGFESSPFWGDQLIWRSVANPHNLMIDGKNRLGMSSSTRANAAQPDFCKEGTNNPFGKAFPLPIGRNQLQYYDMETAKWGQVNTCFGIHHFHFTEDKSNTLYMDGNAGIIGWLDTRVLDETGSQEKAQGWCAAYADVNGNGKYDKDIDKLIPNTYDSSVNPVDGSVWFAVNSYPGMIVRVERGSHPPDSCRTEIFATPVGWGSVGGASGYTPHGIDPDRNGVMWVALGGSGQAQPTSLHCDRDRFRAECSRTRRLPNPTRPALRKSPCGKNPEDGSLARRGQSCLDTSSPQTKRCRRRDSHCCRRCSESVYQYPCRTCRCHSRRHRLHTNPVLSPDCPFHPALGYPAIR